MMMNDSNDAAGLEKRWILPKMCLYIRIKMRSIHFSQTKDSKKRFRIIHVMVQIGNVMAQSYSQQCLGYAECWLWPTKCVGALLGQLNHTLSSVWDLLNADCDQPNVLVHCKVSSVILSRVGEDRRSSIGRSWRSCQLWSICWIGDHIQKDRQSDHRSFVACIQVDMGMIFGLHT